MGTSGSFHGGQSGRVVKLSTHLLLAPRSRMRGAIPPPSIRIHGVVLNSAQGQLYLYL